MVTAEETDNKKTKETETMEIIETRETKETSAEGDTLGSAPESGRMSTQRDNFRVQ